MKKVDRIIALFPSRETSSPCIERMFKNDIKKIIDEPEETIDFKFKIYEMNDTPIHIYQINVEEYCKDGWEIASVATTYKNRGNHVNLQVATVLYRRGNDILKK